jgi:hypothetical protein
LTQRTWQQVAIGNTSDHKTQEKTYMRKLIILAAVLVIASVKAMASNSPYAIFNLSGTAVFNKTNYTTSTRGIATTTTESLNNKFIYNVISNAIASQTNVLAAHLPPNGYIAYNFIDAHSDIVSDGNVNGCFFVTNKAGFYYQLSGYTNETYYSFMELDSSLNPINSSLGFGNYYATNMNCAYSYNVSGATSAGSLKLTQTALLYIHSNPYDYDDLDNIYEFYADNQNAIEISGLFILSGSENGGTATVTGTGKINTNDGLDQGVITSGKASFK